MTRSTPANTSTRHPAYVVGAQSTPRPLVLPEHVKGHLRLLRMFCSLRVTVDEGKDCRIPAYALRMDKATRWRWFVHLAVERYVLPLYLRPLAPSHRLCGTHLGLSGGFSACSSSHLESLSRDIFHPRMSGWCGMRIYSVRGNYSPCFHLLGELS